MTEREKNSVLTLGYDGSYDSTCLPCYVRNNAWSLKQVILIQPKIIILKQKYDILLVVSTKYISK